MPDRSKLPLTKKIVPARARVRKAPPYIDVRPAWTTNSVDAKEARIAQFEICDAILRNNHSQAMHALGIITWSENPAETIFDEHHASLVNPNLIDTEAPWAWQFFRRELSHRSLLHEAVAYSSAMFNHSNDTTITRMLLAKSAMFQIIEDSGNTPLHIAAYANNAPACEILIAAGADMNLRSRRGQTPLHTAVHNNSVAACEILLASGADPTIRNVRGETPAAMAQNKNYSETSAAILSAQARQTMRDVFARVRNTSIPDTYDDGPTITRLRPG